MDEAVAVGRVGLTVHLVDGIDEAILGGGGRDALGDVLVALGRAEFRRSDNARAKCLRPGSSH